MALLQMLRAPQPKAAFPFPSYVAGDGLFRGWAIPSNPMSLFPFNQLAFDATGPLGYALGCRWGRLRGIIAGILVPVPPPPPP